MQLKNIGKMESMEAIFQTLLNVIEVGIHVIDRDGKTIIYNHKMAEIEGMAIEDVLDKEVQGVFMFPGEMNSTLLQALREGTTTKNTKQTYFNNREKEITTINDTFPIRNDRGHIIGAIEVARDVTKLERMIRENILHKGDTFYTFDSLVGKSAIFQEVIENSKRATRTASSVLLVGETGTGKELFAQSIHNGSNRSSKPFISQNCAALPDNLIEGLLFGTKKGAFTGSIERPGLFEQAEGGTLLLDEINSLNPSLQAKLLRAIQERTIRRVGDIKDKKIDVRIIATINEDPIDAISKGKLRKDLYYRLGVVSLFLPPLRERKDDIELLATTFIKKYNYLFDMNVKGISLEVYELFMDHDWPGNVRELEHIIEGAMNLLDNESIIQVSHLPVPFRKKTQFKEAESEVAESITKLNPRNKRVSQLTLEQYMKNAEKAYIEKMLIEHNANITKTAKALNISRQSLQYRLKKYTL
ncbi:sigma-54 interaction domain-containing protein [Sutcliffiella cohnii]|uniref:sigma-54 interaction domain-containing protein n=1 Tax=Sutcliffiella cohnii TaxID=33932 RepID=UPI002E20B9B1|nr:sigma 54-interacting transcriptional regulator [Sutcliffiella cohnii]MED4016019.1 sigma 54-interacting transcriptional regulator [Sutcliffiella cohnii]